MSVSMASTPRRARRPVLPAVNFGGAASTRVAHSGTGSPTRRLPVRKEIGIVTGAWWRCADSAAATSTPGWCPRDGRSRTGDTPGSMLPRRCQRKRRGEGSGVATLSRPGTGGQASAYSRSTEPPGVILAKPLENAGLKETSAARAHASTMCPEGRYYERTKISPSSGERWFCSEAEARSAGWRRVAALTRRNPSEGG